MHSFLVGSRLWGTHQESHSDYDYLIISDNDKNITPQNHPSDVRIISYQQFIQLLKDHSFIETICYHLPSSQFTFAPVKFNKQLWRKSILYRIDRDIAYSNKNYSKGKLQKSSKTLFYCLLMLTLAIQLVKEQTIIDPTAAKDLHKINWTPEKFEPIYQQLLTEFLSITQ